MMRASVLALLLGCSPALAQVAPASPSKPTVAKPAPAKPPVAPQVAPVGKPAVSARLSALQSQLKSVDTQIAALRGGGEKDSISELTQQDMLQLQALMERKNQLEQMISNVMRNSSESGGAAVPTLKAS